MGSLLDAKGEAVGVRSQLQCFQLFFSSEVYDEIYGAPFVSKLLHKL